MFHAICSLSRKEATVPLHVLYTVNPIETLYWVGHELFLAWLWIQTPMSSQHQWHIGVRPIHLWTMQFNLGLCILRVRIPCIGFMFVLVYMLISIFLSQGYMARSLALSIIFNMSYTLYGKAMQMASRSVGTLLPCDVHLSLLLGVNIKMHSCCE